MPWLRSRDSCLKGVPSRVCHISGEMDEDVFNLFKKETFP